MAKKALDSGAALEKFRQMCIAQKGDHTILERPQSLYEKAAVYELAAPQDGWIRQMDAEACGRASMLLGAGRETKDSAILLRGLFCAGKPAKPSGKGKCWPGFTPTVRIAWNRHAGFCWKAMCSQRRSQMTFP